MTNPTDKIALWAESHRRRLRLTQAEFGKILNVSQPQARLRLQGHMEFSPSELEVLARKFGEAPPVLENKGATTDPEIKYINEYDVTVSAGNGAFVDSENVKSQWPFHKDYLVGYLGLKNANVVLLEVAGDSMEPTLSTGDRVMVNTNDVQISQPGIFVVYDGYGTVIKRVERILNGEGGMRLISDNQRHTTYEVNDSSVKVIGRVIWAAKRL